MEGRLWNCKTRSSHLQNRFSLFLLLSTRQNAGCSSFTPCFALFVFIRLSFIKNLLTMIMMMVIMSDRLMMIAIVIKRARMTIMLQAMTVSTVWGRRFAFSAPFVIRILCLILRYSVYHISTWEKPLKVWYKVQHWCLKLSKVVVPKKHVLSV